MTSRAFLDVVAEAGLPPADIEREKRIEMAAAVIATARNTEMRRRALRLVLAECEARSPAALAAIGKAQAR